MRIERANNGENRLPFEQENRNQQPTTLNDRRCMASEKRLNDIWIIMIMMEDRKSQYLRTMKI